MRAIHSRPGCILDDGWHHRWQDLYDFVHVRVIRRIAHSIAGAITVNSYDFHRRINGWRVSDGSRAPGGRE